MTGTQDILQLKRPVNIRKRGRDIFRLICLGAHLLTGSLRVLAQTNAVDGALDGYVRAADDVAIAFQLKR